MRFSVSPDVFDAFPGMRIVAVLARDVNNGIVSPALANQWQKAWSMAEERREYGNSQSHPFVAPWRNSIQRLGFSGKKFPSSIEALLRRALKGGEPFSVNPLVDFYNSISLSHVVPAGGFDVAELESDLDLRFTNANDEFQAFDQEVPIAVNENEVAYTTDTTVLTRHVVWRQSRRALITERTSTVLLVSEILGELPDDLPDLVEQSFLTGLEEFFGVRGESRRLDKESHECTW